MDVRRADCAKGGRMVLRSSHVDAARPVFAFSKTEQYSRRKVGQVRHRLLETAHQGMMGA